mmetsp:Transcript_24831/g.59085  ORF Transcript_24831/g.59085 Transcript_24831/m.59085 type:complete len:543 (+) Transcript_24831:178-1806(+)
MVTAILRATVLAVLAGSVLMIASETFRGSTGSAEPTVMLPEEVARYKQAAKDMFYHSYDSYMAHAFPKDELAPISCSGHDTHNCRGCLLTFYDALDTLAVLGNRTEFQRVVNWLANHGAASFDREVTVSVFETNIRVLGSLISNHLLASDPTLNLMPGYNNELLTLAVDIGDRLLKAYQTVTGLPYGSVNLKTGINFGETAVSATATGGTVLLEFILLSKISGDKKYAKAADKATRKLWESRSPLGLLGSHINVQTGEWVYLDSGIGGGIDSFFEYLLKAHVMTGKETYLEMFEEGYAKINTHVKKNGWYVDVDMKSGQVMFPYYRSLQSFWPGLQVLYGDLEEAKALFQRFFGVWTQYGFVPEAFNLLTNAPQEGLGQYPLRPELAESAFYLYRATGEDAYRLAGAKIIDSLNSYARVECGYAAVENVTTKALRDHMDSYFLAETVKYLYLLFDESEETAVFRDPTKYIFNTEAHLLPVSKVPAQEFLLSPTNPPDHTARKKRLERINKSSWEKRDKKRREKAAKKKEQKDGAAAEEPPKE